MSTLVNLVSPRAQLLNKLG